MHRAFLISLCCFALVMTGVRAQDEPPRYRLRTPTLEEYLAEMLIPVRTSYDGGNNIYNRFMRDAVMDELSLRYSESEFFHMPFDILNDAFNMLAISANSYGYKDPEIWSLALLTAWLREHPTDLRSETELEIGYFTITTTPRDFNADGQVEYVLLISDGFLNVYLVAIPDDDFETGYRLLTTPLPWLSRDYHYSSMRSGQFTTLRFQDLNRDRLPEWIVLLDSFGSWTSEGDLYVLTWRDNQLIDLTAGGISYSIPGIGGGFKQPDWIYKMNPEGILEIEMRYEGNDGWGCRWLNIGRLDWDGTDYRVQTGRLYDRSLNCSLSDGHAKMQQRDFASAVRFFEDGLRLPEASDQVRQFTQAQLALAYILSGRNFEAAKLLANSVKTGQMGDLLERMRQTYARTENPQALCQTMYDFIAETNASYVDGDEYPYSFTVGAYFDRRWEAYQLPEPAFSGCDPEMIAALSAPTATPSASALSIYDRYMLNSHFFPAFSTIKYYGYSGALEIIDEVSLDQRTIAEPHKLYMVRYWRGFVLEALNRPDEALAEYAAIYEAAPESAWGMLAALHLEPLEG